MKIEKKNKYSHNKKNRITYVYIGLKEFKSKNKAHVIIGNKD